MVFDYEPDGQLYKSRIQGLLGLSNPSLFNSLSINIFKDLVLKDLDKLTIKQPHKHPSIKLGQRQLYERNDLVIRPADKGGGIVVFGKMWLRGRNVIVIPIVIPIVN